MSERSPFTDPQCGDELEHNGVHIQVHFVERGQVYYAKWKGKYYGKERMALKDWTEQCIASSPTIVVPLPSNGSYEDEVRG